MTPPNAILVISLAVEASTTIPNGSRAKWLEAPSPSVEGEDIVFSHTKV